MLGQIDHVGYLAADLETSLEAMVTKLGLPVAKRFERPRFELVGAYLGEGHPGVEIFTFTDPELTARRLAGRGGLVLDHVAWRVAGIEALCVELRARGVRFCGPDNREELAGPVELDGVLHVWTVPETSCGQSLQLLQPLATAHIV